MLATAGSGFGSGAGSPGILIVNFACSGSKFFHPPPPEDAAAESPSLLQPQTANRTAIPQLTNNQRIDLLQDSSRGQGHRTLARRASEGTSMHSLACASGE